MLRRVAILLGVLGAALLIAFSRQISTLTFGSDNHAIAVRLLSATVFFSCLSGGQAALIQGMRRISDLVRMGVLGAAAGAIISIPIVYFLREDGIVPSLICGAAIALIVSWWYSRKIEILTPSMTVAQLRHEAAGLLKPFGEAFPTVKVGDHHHFAAIGLHGPAALVGVKLVVDQHRGRQVVASRQLSHKPMHSRLGAKARRAGRHLGNVEDIVALWAHGFESWAAQHGAAPSL